MTIYQRMAQVFRDAEIPGFLQEWMATDEYPVIPDKYAAYLVEQESTALSADDDEYVRVYRVWVDLYGMCDISAELDALRAALKAAGFLIPYVRDLDNAGLSRYQYHRRMRVDYYEYL